MSRSISLSGALLLLLGVLAGVCQAHHVIGRPVYSAGEGDGSPATVRIDVPIGAYQINYLASPAFPQPGQPGRMRLAIRRIEGGAPFSGTVSFQVSEDGWFAAPAETIGEQQARQGVVEQGFEFSRDGQYIIRARFDSDGQPYKVDFPMQVGNPQRWLAMLLAVAVVLVTLSALRLRNKRNKRGAS